MRFNIYKEKSLWWLFNRGDSVSTVEEVVEEEEVEGWLGLANKGASLQPEIQSWWRTIDFHLKGTAQENVDEKKA